jgi:hypothetical protein
MFFFGPPDSKQQMDSMILDETRPEAAKGVTRPAPGPHPAREATLCQMELAESWPVRQRS